MKKIEVIAYFGTQQKVAKALGISQGCVSKWKEDIPYLRACQIQIYTENKLKVETQKLIQ